MGEKQYQSTDLGAKDIEKIHELLAQANPYEADELKAACKNGLEGWWYGTYCESNLLAVAHIDEHVVHLYAHESEPMVHLGISLARQQGKRDSGKQHQIFGADDVVLAFWQGFERSEKTIVANIKLNMCRLTDIACKQNDAYTERLANKKDLPLIVEFLGEALIDELGMDLRRVGRDSLERMCADWIANERIHIGFHRGKPALVLKYSEQEGTVMIDQAFYPVAMRRPKVMRGTMARICETLLQNYTTIMYYADSTKQELVDALAEVGYETIGCARVMRLR